jgi:lysine 6-dehydrogenase
MHYVVFGAGLMGRAAAWYLSKRGASVLVVDQDDTMLQQAKELVTSAKFQKISVSDKNKVLPLLAEADAAISCVPYMFNLQLSQWCIESKTHMVDLGGNNDVVDQQFALSEKAREAGITIIPDCGLAPGMIGIFAMEGANALDECEKISMYCGGLPQNPQPPLNYMQLFSINGLINEYIEPCRILRDGVQVEVPGMSGVEAMSFAGPPYDLMEAFYTSGGTSTLVETLKGRVENLEYKTLRYQGHIEFFRTLAALGMLDSEPYNVGSAEVAPRQLIQEILSRNLPSTGPDVTLLRVDCEGLLEQRPTMIRFQCIDKADETNGLSSMMRCTAFPAAAIAQMLAEGSISMPGTQSQELVVPPTELRKHLKEHGIIIEKLISNEFEVID